MSSAAIPVHVALVDETGAVGLEELGRWAAALNEHVQADFGPVWHVRASVGAYAEAPAGAWAVRVRRKLDQPGALGYHTDLNHQPYALVELTDSTSVTIAHELDEMLADPWGSRMHAARLPDGLEIDYHDFGLPHSSSRVAYLLEVCDPCEATSYEIGGVQVSDFLLPAWYRTQPAQLTAFSHAGGCHSQRQVAEGGYVSFMVRESGEWFQVFNESGALQVQSLGKFAVGHADPARGGMSVREWTDFHAQERRAGRR